MGVTAAQKTAIEEIIQIIIHTTPPRGKRKLSALYIDLVERADYPEYYEVSVSYVHSTVYSIDRVGYT